MDIFDFLKTELEGRYEFDSILFRQLVRYVSFYTAVEIFGFDIKSLNNQNLKKIIMNFSSNEFLFHSSYDKQVRKKLCIVGAGGVGGNFLSYILFARYKFDKLVVYDDDIMEFQNSIRSIVFNPFGEIKKVDFYRFLFDLFNYRDVIFYDKRFEENDIDKDSIYFGAPDFLTRELIVENKLRYIFLLHHQNDFYLFSNLKYISNEEYIISGAPVFEGYGRINLFTYFKGLISYYSQIVKRLLNP